MRPPQVGILKRIVVIDIGEGPIILVNPEILETAGEQTGEEGCLSLPGKSGTVTRPNLCESKRRSMKEMEEVVYEGEGLLARAFCHEIDHFGRAFVCRKSRRRTSQCGSMMMSLTRKTKEETADESNFLWGLRIFRWAL